MVGHAGSSLGTAVVASLATERDLKMQDRTEKRLTELESALAHLQHDFEAQNEVILANSQRLLELENSLRAIVRRLESVRQGPEIRNLEDERPPHY